MLQDMLRLIAEGQVRTQDELARALDVSPDMVLQMAEQLVRTGYLAEARTCSEGCGHCPLKAACGPSKGLRFWSLTEKGRKR